MPADLLPVGAYNTCYVWYCGAPQSSNPSLSCNKEENSKSEQPLRI